MDHLLRPRNWEPACGTERSAASANYMAVLPGLGPRVSAPATYRSGTETNPVVPRDELPGGTPIFVVSRQLSMKYPG
jgi:hypothetical protein